MKTFIYAACLMMQMKYLIPILLVACLLLAGCAQQNSDNGPDDTSGQDGMDGGETPSDNDENVYDFAINNMTISSIDWEVGERVTIYPLVRNLGSSVENLEVEITANDEVIKTYRLQMRQGERKQLIYQWVPEEPGAYNIRTELDPNNEFVDIHPENNAVNLTIGISSQEE